MKIRALVAGLVSALVLASTAQSAESPAPPASASTGSVLALVGGRVIDGFGGAPIEHATVLIRGNRIERVGSSDSVPLPADARKVDTSGMTVLPGLWESHGHLMHIGEGDPEEFPHMFASRARDVMAAVARTTLMSGITTFRDTGGPLDEQLALRAEINAGKLPGPRLFVAGPILHQGTVDPKTRGQTRFDAPIWVANAAEARRATEQLIARGVDQIKVYGFWDVEVLKGVTSTAHARGLGVDADVRHIVAYRTAIEAGVDRLHHVFTADPLSSYSDDDWRMLVRGVKPTGSGPMANILRGPYIVPTIEMRRAYVRAVEFPGLVDQPRFRAEFPPDVYEHLRGTWTNVPSIPWGIGAAERVKVAKTKLRYFIENGGREQIVAGTDAGAPTNVHSPLRKEIRNLYESGLTAMEAIQAATLRAAQMQGQLKDLGTVTAGKLADIIVVDGDPLQDLSVLEHRLVLVIKDGKPYQPDRQTLSVE